MTSSNEYIAAARVSLLRQIFEQREGKVGLILTGVMLVVILLGPFVAPYSPTDINLAPANSGPDGAHWFGTDHLGRDILSRFLNGGQTIILFPLIAVTIAYALSGMITLMATYRGGLLDTCVNRGFELMMSLPGLLLTLILVAAFGPTTPVLILSIVIGNMPGTSWMVRGAVLGQLKLEYVQSAQLRGETTLTVVLKEILPNIAVPLMADFTLRITWGIIALSTLSFLGLGVQPPTPDWGLMIEEARSSLRQAPLAAIVPALGIVFLAIGLNLTADAIVNRYSNTKT